MHADVAARLHWQALAPVPAGARGAWCRIAAGPVPDDAVVVAAFPLPDGTDHWIYLHETPSPGQRRGLGHLPPGAETFRIGVMGPAPGALSVTWQPMGQARAALLLLRRHGRALLRRLLAGEAAILRDPRETLAALVVDDGMPRDYALWCRLFDTWRPDDIAAVPASLGVLVFSQGAPAPLAATLASIAAQDLAVPSAVARDGAWPALACDHLVILQAGEVLPPHATRLLAAELAKAGNPALACAEEDALDAEGRRHSPHFKPQPSLALMLSGTLTRGPWVVRRDLLDAPGLEATSAETLRLDLWLREGRAARIPYVLAHRRPDAEATPPEALRARGQAHLDRAGLPWRLDAGWPLRLRATGGDRPRVAILVASALRAAHVGRCLEAVLRDTAYADWEVIVGVAQPGPLDAGQAALAGRLARDARVRVVPIPMPVFNFAAVNNVMAAMTDAPVLLLLNDDVAPIGADWLDRMVGWLADPAVAVVGPRLLYPDGSVQHGGVLMGMGGLCNHLHRHLAPGGAGYQNRAVLPQALSAVTGACLLVRHAVFDALGGLDEAYASAFNDVDFCLRVGEAGLVVLYDGATALTHFEGKSFGDHYAGERARRRAAEMARMRSRWAGVVAADPFHSPNLRLESDAEFQPAFPPRITPR